MAAITLPLFYSILFALFIYKAKFFIIPTIPKPAIVAVFLFKIIFGTLLWGYYTYSPDGITGADIYKYFNESKLVSDVFYTRPLDYIKLMTGIGNDTPYFYQKYYSLMNAWNPNNKEVILLNGSRTIIRFNALVRIFSGGNYHVHTVFMSFASLVGLTFLYKAFITYLSDKKTLLFIVIFLIPTVLFWGSGVLKEGLLLLGFGMLFYSAINFFKDRSQLKMGILLAFSITLLLIVKVYVLLCCLPFLIVYGLNSRSSTYKIVYTYMGAIFAIVVLVVSVHIALPRYSVFKLISKKQNDFLNVAQGGTYIGDDHLTLWIKHTVPNPIIATKDSGMYRVRAGINYCYWKTTHTRDTIFVNAASDTNGYPILLQCSPAGSVVNIARLKPTVGSIVKNSVYALAYAFYSPVWPQANTTAKKASWLENVMIIVFMVICLIFRLPIHKINLNLLLFCLLFALSTYLLVGLTTPIAGAIMRYKMPAIPFLLIAFLLIFDVCKFKTWLATFKKSRAD